MTRGSSLGAPTRGNSNGTATQPHSFRTHQSRLFGRRGISRVFTPLLHARRHAQAPPVGAAGCCLVAAPAPRHQPPDQVVPPSVRERRPLLLLAASPVELPPSRISNPGAGAGAPCAGRNLPQVADPRFGATVRVLRANAAVVRTRVVVTGGSVLTRSSDEPGPEKRG